MTRMPPLSPPESPVEIPPMEIPFVGRWHYSRAEMIADGIVHAVGIVLAIAAGSALLALAAFHAGPGEYVAAVFFVVSLLTVLSVSLTYNLWPVTSPAKWILRRFDHAAIYLLIAATYTPFLAQLDNRRVEVVAHECEFVVRRLTGMDAKFGGRELENQPAAARIDAGYLEHVTQKGAVRILVQGEEHDMRATDHGLPPSLRPVDASSWRRATSRAFSRGRPSASAIGSPSSESPMAARTSQSVVSWTGRSSWP